MKKFNNIYFEKYLQSINKEQTEYEVEIKEEESGHIISGGLKPIGQVGGMGLQYHYSYKPKITNNQITITKIVK